MDQTLDKCCCCQKQGAVGGDFVDLLSEEVTALAEVIQFQKD